MSNCAAQVFSGVTAEQFAEMQTRAVAEGMEINGIAGVCSHSGVTIEYEYDAIAETLTLTVTGKPFVVSCGMVNGRLHDLVESVLEGSK